MRSATREDGSCTFDVRGCTDRSASNFDRSATVNDGSCMYAVPGCCDRDAMNFDPRATTNDGSCRYEVRGCTDTSAPNYNRLANRDDGSCLPACPARVAENVSMPTLSFGCSSTLDVLYNEWCKFMSDHADFSTNDVAKA